MKGFAQQASDGKLFNLHKFVTLMHKKKKKKKLLLIKFIQSNKLIFLPFLVGPTIKEKVERLGIGNWNLKTITLFYKIRLTYYQAKYSK